MLKPNIMSTGDFSRFEDMLKDAFPARRTFAKGKLIMGLSAYGNFRYYVLQGKVSRSYLDTHGGRHTFGMCGPGSILPLYYEHAQTLLERTVEFVAAEEVVAIPMPSSEIGLLIRKHPDFSIAMMNAWCEYATYLMYRIEVQFDSVDRRVCGFLLLHSENSPTIRATHAEIAQAMGTTRENVTRVLARLKREDIVELKRGAIIVKSRDRLCRFSSYIAINE